MKFTIPLIFVPFYPNGYHILVQGKVSQKKIFLIIDTGATETVFNEKLSPWFYNIDNNTEVVDSYGIQSESFSASKAYLKTFRLNDFTVRELPVQLIDMRNINQLYQQVTPYNTDGLLGGDFLKKYKAVIDYNHEKLILTV